MKLFAFPVYTTDRGDPADDCSTTTWSKSLSPGSNQVSFTTPSEALAASLPTGAGGFVSGGGGGGTAATVTVTEEEATVLLPALSVAVNVTVVVPIGNEPGALFATGTVPSTRSVAFAEPRNAEIVGSLAGKEFGLLSVIAAGMFMRGAVVSTTVTTNDECPEFPWPSEALQVTVVLPSGNVEPDTGRHLMAAGVSGPSTRSLAEVVKVTTAPAGPLASRVRSAGTVTEGGVVSPTVTWKEALPLLPLLSVAVQVTVVGPSGKFVPEAGEQVGVMAPSMLSLAAAGGKVTVAPPLDVASCVMLAGTVTTGFVVSTSVIVNEAVPVLPCASVALQVTVVGPSGKFVPEAGEQVGVMGPSMLSLAVAGGKVTVVPPLDVASCVMLAGTVTTGFVVSTSVTVTLKEAEPWLPWVSVAVQLTLVVATRKFVPDAGEQVGVMAPSMLSLAEAVKVTLLPDAVVVVVVMSAGTVTTGGVVSTSVTVIVNEPVPLLPCASVALQVDGCGADREVRAGGGRAGRCEGAVEVVVGGWR